MIYSADWLIPISSLPLREGALRVLEGHIEDVGLREELIARYPGEEERHFPQSVILPGLVNAHCHLDYSFLRAVDPSGGLFPWLRRLIQSSQLLYPSSNSPNLLPFALLGAGELVKGGVTTVADATPTGTSLLALNQVGLRGVVFLEAFGSDASLSPKQVVDQLSHRLESLQPYCNERVQLGISPHSPYTVYPSLFKALVEFARKEGYFVMAHVAETRQEREMLLGLRPLQSPVRDQPLNWPPPIKAPVRYLYDLGVLDPRFIGVHCIHLDEEEVAILAQTGAKVVTCPKSNCFLGVGIPPLQKMKACSIPLGLGTDSSASSGQLNLWEEARLLVYLHRAVEEDPHLFPPQEVIQWMTLGGAEVLGLDHEIGSLEKGKRADFIVVRFEEGLIPSLQDLFSFLLFSCGPERVVLTVVEGKVLWDGSRLWGLEEEDLRKEVFHYSSGETC